MTSTLDLIKDRFDLGVWLEDDGSVISYSALTDSAFPVRYDGDRPVYEPLRQRVVDHGYPSVICPRCSEPTWHITRHAVERHGDSDVEVTAPLPGKTPPDWFRPEWV